MKGNGPGIQYTHVINYYLSAVFVTGITICKSLLPIVLCQLEDSRKLSLVRDTDSSRKVKYICSRRRYHSERIRPSTLQSTKDGFPNSSKVIPQPLPILVHKVLVQLVPRVCHDVREL